MAGVAFDRAIEHLGGVAAGQFAQFAHELEPIHLGHAPVDENDVRHGFWHSASASAPLSASAVRKWKVSKMRRATRRMTALSSTIKICFKDRSFSARRRAPPFLKERRGNLARRR